MNILSVTKKYFTGILYSNSKNAYKKWAGFYDQEQDNLMLLYDSIILNSLLSKINLSEKQVLDYGCGTGRNWKVLSDNKTKKITGCDISSEMLEKLIDKYPAADVHLINNYKLDFIHNNSVDLIISTLVLAHIKHLEIIFTEWDRVTKENGDIIITDFHPALLEKGGERTFSYKNETIRIKNYVHNIPEIESLLKKYGFKVIQKIERNIDEEVKKFYEKKNAIRVYENFYNTPFIYGLHLRR